MVTAPQTPPSSASSIPIRRSAGANFNDSAAVELGTRFHATEAGQITELKYWRTSADAGDTDTRAGRLWDNNGNLLATVTFTSAPGETGWQVATLTTPVQIAANTDYVVSYRTTNNYVATSAFFSSDYTEPFGKLIAPAGQNGVYAYNTAVVFPTQTYQASNYWADVSFKPGTAGSSHRGRSRWQPGPSPPRMNSLSPLTRSRLAAWSLSMRRGTTSTSRLSAAVIGHS